MGLGQQQPEPFDPWVARLLAADGMAGMGHGQVPERNDLGLGWVYYSLTRVAKPETAMVIGSWRGFVPLLIARALADNGKGRVVFIDPSLVDDFWRNPQAVQAHFASFGIHNIEHHRMTTQEFAASPQHAALGPLGLVFVDGYHSKEQARFDFETFRDLIPLDGLAVFHDSWRVRQSGIYGKPYTHTVREYMNELAQDRTLQVLDLPYADGITLVRSTRLPDTPRTVT